MRLRFYIWFLCLGFFGCSERADTPVDKSSESVIILTTKKEFVAGEPILLQFDEKAETQLLILRNAWGTFGILPDPTETKLSFTLPTSVSQKSGNIRWILVHQKSIVSKGSLTILPSNISSNAMETYIGPTSIFADDVDLSMVVSLPQDIYGNPLPEGTQVTFTEKFKEVHKNDSMMVRDMIAHHYVGAHNKVGNLFVGVAFKKQVSKELTVNVLPTKAVDFTISPERQHHFADGNQIVSFKTSTIQDTYGNTVADGTLVNFMVKDDSGNSYQTYGQTLNGVAIGKMLHPEIATHWSVKAHISGMSKSNGLELDFDAAVLDYPILFSDNGQKITVGPILSYMNQWVPDGMGIHLEVFNSEGKLIWISKITSRKGMGSFVLPENINPSQNTIITTVSGIRKTIQNTPK